jgi:bifunctional non-homologous end joining protein LigD
MAPLDEYRRKRNPRATSEPMPGAIAPGAGDTFVVQEHHARALHWDFRLERDGVLVSWALPKGLPTDPSVNRLAVHVEDHPLDYGGYEGTIGSGQYGAGRVESWDHGTYDTETWDEREVKVVLHGERVQGRFVLFRTDGENWMMHRMDGPPRPDWVTLPTWIEPMRASAGELPRGRGWSFEMAWPGLRAVLRVEGGRIEIRTGADREVSASFPELRAIGDRLGATQVLLDGVIAHIGADGRPDPSVVDRRRGAAASRARTLARREPTVFLAVDVLHLDGRPLIATAYRARRELLDSIDLGGSGQVPPAFDGSGREALRTSVAQHLPGIVAKRQAAPYQPGARSPDWIAVTAI